MPRCFYYPVVVITAWILAFVSLWLGFTFTNDTTKKVVLLLGFTFTNDTTKKVVLVFWTLVPPIWFQIEWVFLCKEGKGMSGPDFNNWLARFKHSQELASKVWLALVSVLLALFYGEKFFKG